MGRNSCFSFRKNVIDEKGLICRSVVMQKHPRLLNPQFGSLVSDRLTQMTQDVYIEFFVYHASFRDIFQTHNALDIEKYTPIAGHSLQRDLSGIFAWAEIVVISPLPILSGIVGRIKCTLSRLQ
ncbi:hypothetical protein TNCV_89491 [Trichonephila clavipes]|nr:hypothetical protein TNCV_89491 [Trichonephila clavipes]